MPLHGAWHKVQKLTKFTVRREMQEFLNMQSVYPLELWNLRNLLILQRRNRLT